MDYSRNPKVIGAFLVGFAMVAGAYLANNFGEPRVGLPSVPLAVADTAPARVFIPTSDQNADGLEDWRDQFISAPAVNLAEGDVEEVYTPPTTLTGQLGVSIMEGLITVKGAGSLGKSEEMVVSDAIKQLERVATADIIYDVRDIIISEDYSDETIRSYGNALANILITESAPDMRNELVILRDYLESGKAEDLADLKKLASVYKNYRDATLNTPVPKIFVKEHLDLINVYNALYTDLDTMTKASEDPMLPYVRLKRYEDDVNGMALAMTNIYDALVPYARVFRMNDSVMMFANLNAVLTN
ncbi:MAG: hypothetical protein R3B53_00605 [Candidatus Paceibacterota bacterium]